MNDLSFRLPDNFPSARRFLIATSVRSAHDHQPPVRRPPYPRFHATELPHGLTRAMLLEEIRRPSSRIPVTAWTGSITIFHETGSRSERTGAIRPQQHLLC